ncbi:hypothetical protein, partial [Nocardia jiangxiensis]
EQIADRREAAADARDERLDAWQRGLSAGVTEDSVTQSTWEAIERARAVVALGARRWDRNVAASLRCESREVRQQAEIDRNVANARRRGAVAAQRPDTGMDRTLTIARVQASGRMRSDYLEG